MLLENKLPPFAELTKKSPYKLTFPLQPSLLFLFYNETFYVKQNYYKENNVLININQRH